MSAPLSEAVALRIGMAARELPGADARQLVEILIAAVGQPMTAARLSRLRLNRLKQAAAGSLKEADDGDFRRALAFLKGRGIQCEEEPLPAIERYREGDMSGSIRVACSSDSGEKIGGHFGTCPRFLIYQVGAGEARLIDIRPVPALAAEEDKNTRRAALIGDCHVLCTTSIGGPATAKVVRAGLHPIKLKRAQPASELIGQLQRVLRASPPPWLAKAMGEDPLRRVRFSQEVTP